MTTPNHNAVEYLIELTSSSSHSIKIAAITALGEAGGQEAVNALITLSKNGTHSITMAAIAALGRAGRIS